MDPNLVYQQLIEQGIPPGIAWEQAQAAAAVGRNNFAHFRTNTDNVNALTGLGVNRGLPGYLDAAIQTAAFDPRSYSSETAAQLAGMSPEYFGGFRGIGGDSDPRYKAYIQAIASAIRSEAMRNGEYLSQEQALDMARQYGQTQDVFDAQRNVASLANVEGLNQMAESQGMDMPMAALPMFRDSGNLMEDFKTIYGLHPTDAQKAAAKALSEFQALRGSSAATADEVANALHKYTGLAREARAGVPLVKAIIPSLAAVQAAGETLSRNDRGDDWLKNLQRLTRWNRDLAVDQGDYLRAGASLPAEALAQSYVWSTLPTRAIQAFKGSPFGAVAGAGAAGATAMGLAGLAPDLAIMGLGKYLGADRSVYELAKAQRDFQRKLQDDKITGEGTAAATNWSGMADIGRRGLFSRMRYGFDDPDMGTGMKALSLLGDTATTLGDALYLPVKGASNIAGTLGGAVDWITDGRTTFGSTMRRALDPSQWGSVVAQMRDSDELDKIISDYESSGARERNTDAAHAEARRAARGAAQSTLTNNPDADLKITDTANRARDRLKEQGIEL